MAADLQFLHIVESLLNAIGQDGRALTAEKKEIYTLEKEGLSIELVGSQPGFINLFALVDEFEMLSYHALFTLTLQNGFQPDYPAISYSLLMLDNDRARVSLWLRLKLEEATPAILESALERLLLKANEVQSWLAEEFTRDDAALQAAGE